MVYPQQQYTLGRDKRLQQMVQDEALFLSCKNQLEMNHRSQTRLHTLELQWESFSRPGNNASSGEGNTVEF